MCHIVTIAGCSARYEKSAALLDYARKRLRRSGVHTHDIVVRGLNRGISPGARESGEDWQAAGLLLEQAEGVIIAASYSQPDCMAALSEFLNLLPTGALAGKSVFLLGTGDTREQPLAMEYPLSRVLSTLGATPVLPDVYASETQMQLEHGGLLRLDSDIEWRLRAGLEALTGERPLPARGKRPALIGAAVTV